MSVNDWPSHVSYEPSPLCRLRFVIVERYQHVCLVKTCQEVVEQFRVVFTRFTTFCIPQTGFVALLKQSWRCSADAREPARTRREPQRIDLIRSLERRMENAREMRTAAVAGSAFAAVDKLRRVGLVGRALRCGRRHGAAAGL
jgi:hypothetical protein